MILRAWIYFAGAAYLLGLGTAVGLFGFLVSRSNSPGRPSRFFFFATLIIAMTACYLSWHGALILEILR